MTTGNRLLASATHLPILLVALCLLGGCGQSGEEQATGEDTQVSDDTRPAEDARSSETSQTAETPASDLLTARMAYEAALEEAEAWADDAVLVDLNNRRGADNLDGDANRWVVKFKSVAMDEQLDVHVVRGPRVLQTMDSKNTDTEAIEGDWMDSPEVAKAAGPHVPDKPTDNYWLGLVSRDGRVSWAVKCDHEDGNATWLRIDARTGEVVEN